MRKPRALVADSSPQFREAVCALLGEAWEVESCADGQQALQLLRQNPMEVLVLDLMLPGLDGISLLRSLRGTLPWPTVLALTPFSSPYVINAVTELEVAYLMRKPCPPRAVAEHLTALCGCRLQPLGSPPDPREQIGDLLHALHVPAKLHGFAFLQEAVVLALESADRPMMKVLYPQVGKPFHATMNQVERDIRSAVQAAWLHREAPAWQQLFPASPSGHRSRPTNAEFILRLADVIRSRQINCDEPMRFIG